MATIHLHQTTMATPEQFVAGLTDFGPGRSELFGNSADDYLKVHDQRPNQADVTEGSGSVWERLPTSCELSTAPSSCRRRASPTTTCRESRPRPQLYAAAPTRATDVRGSSSGREARQGVP